MVVVLRRRWSSCLWSVTTVLFQREVSMQCFLVSVGLQLKISIFWWGGFEFNKLFLSYDTSLSIWIEKRDQWPQVGGHLLPKPQWRKAVPQIQDWSWLIYRTARKTIYIIMITLPPRTKMVSSAFVRMPYRAREDNPLQKEVTQERVFWGNIESVPASP